jgi:hypothetical protein
MTETQLFIDSLSNAPGLMLRLGREVVGSQPVLCGPSSASAERAYRMRLARACKGLKSVLSLAGRYTLESRDSAIQLTSLDLLFAS